MRPRVLAGTVVFLLALSAIPLSASETLKGNFLSALAGPLAFTSGIARWTADLWHFRANAEERRALEAKLERIEFERFVAAELKLENARLAQLLELKTTLPPAVRRAVAARVIGRSPASWNRSVILDKGKSSGVRAPMAVLSGHSVIGKVVEAGPGASKATLLTDPNFRLGVLIQRTRQAGILFGLPSGECRVKYLSLDAEPQVGDVVETAGFGGPFPKGLRVAVVAKVWKEPGQLYRVASVRPVADLKRLEEVLLVE